MVLWLVYAVAAAGAFQVACSSVDSAFHIVPRILATSPSLAVGLAATTSGRLATLKRMYADAGRFGASGSLAFFSFLGLPPFAGAAVAGADVVSAARRASTAARRVSRSSTLRERTALEDIAGKGWKREFRKREVRNAARQIYPINFYHINFFHYWRVYWVKWLETRG